MFQWFIDAKRRISRFLKENPVVRYAGIGAGIGLAVVGATVATVATLGAAAPASRLAVLLHSLAQPVLRLLLARVSLLVSH